MLTPILLIAILAFVVVIVILIVTMRLQAKRAMEVLKKFEGKKVLGIKANANFFGQESLKHLQFRGNGVLIMTEDELYFEMWYPKKEFNIPLSSILSIENPKSHLGKTKGHPLLKIIFQNEKGQKDSMAWLIRDVHNWKKGLDQIIEKNIKNR